MTQNTSSETQQQHDVVKGEFKKQAAGWGKRGKSRFIWVFALVSWSLALVLFLQISQLSQQNKEGLDEIAEDFMISWRDGDFEALATISRDEIEMMSGGQWIGRFSANEFLNARPRPVEWTFTRYVAKNSYYGNALGYVTFTDGSQDSISLNLFSENGDGNRVVYRVSLDY